MNKTFHSILAGCLLALLFNFGVAQGAETAPAPVKKGDVVYRESFSDEKEFLARWKDPKGGAKITKDGLFVEQTPAQLPGDHAVSLKLPVDNLRGTDVYITVMAKAEGISKKPQPWNGVKCRFLVKSAFGDPSAAMANVEDNTYAQATTPEGDFGWTKLGFATSISRNATAIDFQLGLEKVSGKVWFKDVQVKVLNVTPEPPKVAPTGPVYKGHKLSGLRGVEIRSAVSEEDLRVLAEEWNVNVVRWQIGESIYREGLETKHYDAILRHELEQLDRVIPLCRKNRLYMVITLQSLSKRLFVSAANQEKLLEVWRMLANRYKNEPVIWAYDIVNEPNQNTWQEGALLWNDLAQKLAEEIRKIDPNKPLIIETDQMNIPETFATMRPVTVPGVIYSLHMYNPGYFTHNRVWDKQQKIETYPGIIDGVKWDKQQIERNLAPVIAFQKTYGVQIFVGEFGAIRWAPGAGQWVNDCIEVFEKYGWDWTFHSYREWHGWSFEHDADPAHTTPPKEPTANEKMLRGWFSKNQRPTW